MTLSTVLPAPVGQRRRVSVTAPFHESGQQTRRSLPVAAAPACFTWGHCLPRERQPYVAAEVGSPFTRMARTSSPQRGPNARLPDSAKMEGRRDRVRSRAAGARRPGRGPWVYDRLRAGDLRIARRDRTNALVGLGGSRVHRGGPGSVPAGGGQGDCRYRHRGRVPGGRGSSVKPPVKSAGSPRPPVSGQSPPWWRVNACHQHASRLTRANRGHLHFTGTTKGSTHGRERHRRGDIRVR